MKEILSFTKDKISDFSKNSIDFLFHGKKINGKTISDLKNEVKQGVEETVNSIDKKINEIKPDYKESVKNFYNKSKNKTIKIFSDLKKEIFEKKDE